MVTLFIDTYVDKAVIWYQPGGWFVDIRPSNASMQTHHCHTHTHTRTLICQSRWLYPQSMSGADGRSAAAQPWRLRPAPTTGHTSPARRPSTSPGTAPHPGWRPALHDRRDGQKAGETTPTVTGQLQVRWQPVLLWTRRLTRGNEDDVDAKDGVSEPSVEAVEAGHFQGGVEHSPSKQTHTHRVKNNICQKCLNVTAHLEGVLACVCETTWWLLPQTGLWYLRRVQAAREGSGWSPIWRVCSILRWSSAGRREWWGKSPAQTRGAGLMRHDWSRFSNTVKNGVLSYMRTSPSLTHHRQSMHS